MSETTNPTAVLDCPMDPSKNDARATTVREYLVALLGALWDEQEGFSGKRPFGNSGWEWDVYAALVAGGFVTGVVDDDGYLEDADDLAANVLVGEAIKALGSNR